MMDTFELKRLIRRCEDMEHGPPRLRAALTALPLADENGDPWCRITARYLVSWGYLMADDNAKALPYCAEFFYLLEQHPQIKLGAIFELSLACESVTVALCLPQISKEQCRTLLEQFLLRSKQYNMGWYYYHKAAFLFHLTMGAHEEAADSLERFRLAQPDAGWGCAACKAGDIAGALLDLGRTEEALRTAQPLLSGALSCAQGLEPSNILSHLLANDLEGGNIEAAGARAAQLTRMGFEDRSDLYALSMCLLYHAAVDPECALGLLEKGIVWTVGMLDLEDLFYFYRSAWAICSILARAHPTLALQLPQKLSWYREDGIYEARIMADWFCKKALEISYKFDQRNGTDFYARELRWVEKELICHE